MRLELILLITSGERQEWKKFVVDDTSDLTAERKRWLLDRQSAEVHMWHRYKPTKSMVFVELFKLMPNLWHMHFFDMENDKNSDELMEDLYAAKIFKQVKRLQLTTWRTVTKRPLAEYFPFVDALEVEDTKPIHVACFRNQIERYFIRTKSDKIDDWRRVTEIDRCDYILNVLDNSDSLKDLYVLSETADTFDYFRRIAEVLILPSIEKIHLRFYKYARNVDYIIEYDKETRAENRKLIAWNVAQVAETLKSQESASSDRFKVDYLNILIQTKSDIKILTEILHPNIGRIEIKAIMGENLVADIMTEIVRVFNDVKQFSLSESEDRDFIRKYTDESSMTVLEANLKSGRYCDLFKNVQKVHLQVTEANDDNLASFAEWLVQLNDAVEINIWDDRWKLFEMALARINSRAATGIRTWPNLKKLSATVTIFDEDFIKAKFSEDQLNGRGMTIDERRLLTERLIEFDGGILAGLLKGDIVPTLMSFELILPIDQHGSIVERYFKAENWQNVKITVVRRSDETN